MPGRFFFPSAGASEVLDQAFLRSGQETRRSGGRLADVRNCPDASGIIKGEIDGVSDTIFLRGHEVTRSMTKPPAWLREAMDKARATERDDLRIM